MNKFIGIGRLVRDLEMKYTSSNKAYTKFTLAVNRDKENSDFISCIAWEKTAELLTKYCHKGDRIAIDGKIQTGSYDNKDGQKVYTTDVVVWQIEFLNDKKDNQVSEKTSSNEDPFKDFGDAVSVDDNFLD